MTGKKGRHFVIASYKRTVAVAASATLVFICGCGRAPSFNILGSFFPAWLFCIAAGMLLATAAYWLFVRLRLDKDIRPTILVYPCIAAFFAFTLWLIFFS
jgi:hypothetical protein